jgi:hypothetical protein
MVWSGGGVRGGVVVALVALLCAVGAGSSGVAAAASVSPPDDLLASGGFEPVAGSPTGAMAGWAPYDADVTTTTDAKDGRGAVVLRPRRTGAFAVGARGDWGLLRAARGDGRRPAVAGALPRETYVATAWVKGRPGATVRLRIEERDDQGRRIDASTAVATLTDRYAPVRVDHRTTTEVAALDVAVLGRGDDGGPIVVDAVSVRPASLPRDDVQRNASFERPVPGEDRFVPDVRTGWRTFAATVAPAGTDGPVRPPFGGVAAEVRAVGGPSATLLADPPGSVPRSTAGVTYTGRAWIAGTTTATPGTAGVSTVGHRVRLSVREWDPAYRRQVRSSDRWVVLRPEYQQVETSIRAVRDGDHVEVSVALDEDTPRGTRFRVDGLTLTPEVMPDGTLLTNGSFEHDTDGWRTAVAPGAPAATFSSEPAPPDGPPAVHGARTGVLRNGDGRASSRYGVSDDDAARYTYAQGTYTATAWLTGTASSRGRTATLSLLEVGPDGRRIGTPATADVVLDDRRSRRVAVTLHPPRSGSRLRLAVTRGSGATAGETFRVDAVGLSEATVTSRPPDPADPTRAGGTCSWRAALPMRPDTASWFPPSCWRPFPASSPFNAPVLGDDRYTGPDPVVAELTRTPPRPIVAGDPSRSEPNPVFYAQPTDREYVVYCSEPQWSDDCGPEGRRGSDGRPLPPFRMRGPATMRPAGPTDAHLTVVDQDRHEEVDLWSVTSIEDGVIRARTAGRNPGVGSGTGPLVGPGSLVGSGAGLFATADPRDGDGTHAIGSGNAGFSSTAGLIRAQELADGRIDHALAVYVPCAESPVFPASATSRPDLPCAASGLFPAGALRVGQRLELRMTREEIAALDVPGWRKAILQALATYGAYVSDTVPTICETPGPDGPTYPERPATGCPPGTREIRAWGFEYEGATTYTSYGRDDALATFARRAGIPAFDDGGDGTAESVLDLGPGVDWSRLRTTTTRPAVQ